MKDYGFEDFNGHGTACAITIKKLAPNVEIVPIQILSKNGRGSIEQLIAAMELVKNLDVQLVNMSVSSDIGNLKFKLQPIVRSINEQGKICVAAKSNSRSVSIPAEMEEIIGVESSIAIFGTKFKYCKENKIQLLGSGTPELMGYNTKNINFFKGNSKATAVITGQLASIMEKGDSHDYKKNINNYLEANSCSDIELYLENDMKCSRKEIDKTVRNIINKLIKENKIKTIVKKYDDLDFSYSEINDFYTIIYKLENEFDCRIFERTTVYKRYFETINNLSKLVEVSM